MTFFSDSYQSARQNFLQRASAVQAEIKTSYLSEGLAIDSAIIGSGRSALVLTSGLHGVEGFFGSAVQCCLLEHVLLQKIPKNLRIVLVHALNPYGFENIRRFDENGVDLNRNFLLADQPYRGSPPGYQKLNTFLNPDSAPIAYEVYRLRAATKILQYGLPALKEAIVGGQFDYPKGIFFGGDAPAVATEYVINHCEDWAGDAESVAHIDLHSGLGEYGSYKLLVNSGAGSEEHNWYAELFNEEVIGSLQASDDTAYHVTGSMGGWLERYFKNRKYYFAGAEFGTYGPVRVLGAIRAENRVHHYASSNSSVFKAAKAELLECFYPKDSLWRNQVVASSMQIVTSVMNKLASE